MEWQFEEIERLRKQFLEEISQWLEKMKEMQEVFQSLGIEPGVLWDTSIGNLTRQDLASLKTWAEYLKKDEKVRQLCDLMGRFQKEEESHRIEVIERTVRYEVEKPDISSKGEIIGIELGKDLENVIPQERALLSDEDISILFDLKYVESRLLCFSKRTYSLDYLEDIIQEEVEVTDEEKKGPIILCVDTSGSMAGAPETIAKALTLNLAAQASRQKRNCYLINFSTAIETLDLCPPKGIGDLISFLQMSFHGGTDVLPALKEGLQMMQKEEYKRADLLLLSDFILPEKYLDDDVVELAEAQKQNENCFYALAIGDFKMKRIDPFFNREWVYNPKTGSIAELNNTVYWIKNRGA